MQLMKGICVADMKLLLHATVQGFRLFMHELDLICAASTDRCNDRTENVGKYMRGTQLAFKVCDEQHRSLFIFLDPAKQAPDGLPLFG